jgi:pilus assembly protein CpaC
MQPNSIRERAASWWLIPLLIVCFVSQGQAFAAKTPDVVVDMDSGQTINIVVGKLGKLKSRKPVKRAHMVNPAVAELIVSSTQSTQWVFFSAKTAGTTQLTLWDEDNRILAIFNIVVAPDVAELKKKLHEIFPNEKVQVRSSGDYITLNGTVTDTSRMAKVVALAETYAPKGKVLNMLKLGGIQQVMLEVKVAEISRKVGKELGINFAAISDDGNNIFVNTVGSLVSSSLGEGGGVTNTIGGGVNALLGFSGSNGNLLVFIKALEEDGLIKILAEPTLIALSGQNASFLAGGEFPVPSSGGLGTTSIEWKEFGVSLNFTPTVLGDGNLSMRVNPEISELDFSNATFQNGFLIPGLETRRMSTVVEMKDGQSFAIAGLLKSTVRESVSKYPLLGSIPILGALFRSTSYQKNETELVVIVTPHLVKPLDMANQPLPTDSFFEPDTFELLLLGMLEGRAGKEVERLGPTGLEGDFGYIIPE